MDTLPFGKGKTGGEVGMNERIARFKHKLKNFIRENGQDINVYELDKILMDLRTENQVCAMKNLPVSACIGIIDGPLRMRSDPE